MILANTLRDALERAANDSRRGLTFITGAAEERTLSYEGLHCSALRLLGHLQETGLRSGDQLIIRVDDSRTFLLLFWASILGGIVPVPLSVGINDEHRFKLFRVWQTLDRPWIASGAKELASLGEYAGRAGLQEAAGRVQARAIPVDALPEDHPEGVIHPARPSDAAFIQFSSGSTGEPKGVVLTHRNLVVNVGSIARAAAMSADDRSLSWMPLTHDMGLIAIHLTDVALGMAQYLMPPALFVRHPALWMSKASEHRATQLYSPNFGFSHFLGSLERRSSSRRVEEWDLSCVRFIANGAEPISPALCRRFLDTLAPCGLAPETILPVYGLAEGTVAVTISDPRAMFEAVRVARRSLVEGRAVEIGALGDDAVEFVKVGRPIDGVAVRIAGGDDEPLADGTVGRIQIRGESVTSGYFNNPEATRAIMRPGGWLDTGDLGFVRDGQLVITGRAKDIIFVNGQNFYPHDLERVAEQVEGVALGKVAICAIPREESGADDVAAFVVSTAKEAEFADLARRLSVFVAEKTGVPLTAVAPVRHLPKTTSGKVQRYKLGQMLARGELTPVKIEAPEASPLRPRAETVRGWIVERVARRLGVDVGRIDPRVPFAAYGMNSAALVGLTGELSEWLQRPVEPAVVFSYPCIDALAAHLGGEPAADVEATAAGARSDDRDPAIAVIGMACRFPQAPDLDAFWRLLLNGKDAIGEVPAGRWDAAALHDPVPGAAGRMISRCGGFLDGVEEFDAAFFGISPREAESMDPQQRLVLEVAWEALEHAGLAPTRLAGSRTAVCVGISTTDYGRLQRHHGVGLDAYSGVGNALSMAGARLAYFLDLRGPSWVVDTACSSSLVGVHQACRSLRSDEAELAVVGGVNLILVPDCNVILSQARMLSPGGRCRTFDAAADGYVRSEGCGVVVLKRLRDALRDGDDVLAVIRGSAINQDGRSNGLTAPNGLAQERVIADALRDARIPPEQVSYLETHGTGTSLGDPVEVQAAANVLGVDRAAGRPLLLGAVKATIGHTEAAAGIAGLIKTVLAMRHGVIPPQANYQTPNPHIAWPRLPVEVVTAPRPWPVERPIAGVSSFGFSGTNAHVLLEAPAPLVAGVAASAPPARGHTVLPLSARSPASLRALAARYETHLAAHPDLPLEDVAYTAGVARAHLGHRAALVCADAATARARLAALSRDEAAPGVWRGEVGHGPKVAWLFTGQGSQYLGMGKALHEQQPVFRETLERCAALMADALEIPLLDVLWAAADGPRGHLLDQTQYTQPALFALQVSLAALWRSWGLVPSAVMGHSVGDFAAACVAGALSLEDAARLVARRGALMGALPPGGVMSAVEAPRSAVVAALVPEVAIAADNGAHLVISGPADAVASVETRLAAEGARCRRLTTSHAFHSALMEPMLDGLEAAAATVTSLPLAVPFVCNLDERLLEPGRHLAAGYWRRHAREPVSFAAGVGVLAGLDCTALLEIGPQPVLTALAGQRWPRATPPAAVASLRRSTSADRQIAEAFAQLHALGTDLDFAAWDRPWPRRRVALPTYPFDRRRHWVDLSRSPEPVAPTPTLQLLGDGKLEELAGHLGLAGEQEAVTRVLEALHASHVRDGAAGRARKQLYRTEWLPLTSTPARRPPEAGAWLLLTDPATVAVGGALEACLRREGRKVVTARLDPSGDLAAEVAGALEKVGPLAGVVPLAALGIEPEPSQGALALARRSVLYPAVHLAQALLRLDEAAPLFLVTRAARATRADEPVAPHLRPLWGLGQALRREHPRLMGKLVDLGPEEGDAQACAEQLATELLADDAEGEVALRHGARLGARVRRAEPRGAIQEMAVRADASYLVTGGLGALGLQALGWLLERGAGHVVLTSRRGPDEAARQAIDALQGRWRGVVEVAAADVSDEAQVRSLLGRFGRTWPRLAGVIHAAGVLDDGVISEQTVERFERVAQAKVDGAWNLHRLTDGVPLDFFLLYSSVASALGSAGQANYAAANAFLDGLAEHRRSRGLCATAINWGPWAQGGMAASDRVRARLASQGVRLLEAADAHCAMALLVGTGAAGGMVLEVDWARMGEQLGALRPASLSEVLPTSAPPGERLLTRKLREAVAADRQRIVVRHLQGELQRILGLADPPPVSTGFFDLGMDSLMALEFRRRLEAELGCSLPATLAMDRPNIERLADYLLGDVLPATPEEPAVLSDGEAIRQIEAAFEEMQR